MALEFWTTFSSPFTIFRFSRTRKIILPFFIVSSISLIQLSNFCQLANSRMNGKTLYFSGSQEANSGPFWKIKGIGGKRRKQDDKRFSVPEFLNENGRKMEEAVLGPGGGFGVGCGVGVGLGMVGGVGVGGSMWNHLRMVFGIGMGCGVGIGFGYGQGFGIGFTLDDLRSRFFQPKRKSKKLILLQI